MAGQPPAASSAPPVDSARSGEQAPAHDDWSAAWRPVEIFANATTVFGTAPALCATTAGGVRCLGSSTELGPLAKQAITSPTEVWGFIWICGVLGKDLACSHPFSDRPQRGPLRLTDLVTVDVHSAAHADGSLSVTTNRKPTGYAEPKWAKVRAVHDAVQAASSWYDTRSCYIKRSGEVACVANAVDATPKPVGGITDAARIWKTDKALWVLSRSGHLLVTDDLDRPFTEVASSVVAFAPNTAPPGATSSGKEIPCAADEAGVLRCDIDDSGKLTALPGAGKTKAVFGGSGWICAVDTAGIARCSARSDNPR